MKQFMNVLILLLIAPIYGQQTLSLNKCYDLAEKNYPLSKQTSLLLQKSTFEIKALNTAKLPKIDLNAQATYQSDVIGFPANLPGVQSLNKDQYKASLDVNQLIFDGGTINANTKFKEALTETQQQQVIVNMYPLKLNINTSYMMVLLWQEQKALFTAKQNTLQMKLKEVNSGIKNGAVLISSGQMLEAELLKIEQALIENRFEQINELQNLSLLTATVIDENTILERPKLAIETTGVRPEIKFFDLQQSQVEASKMLISKSNLPKLNAFLQAGYGNPGLNMLNNSFDTFYIVGLKLNWNLVDWHKTKTELKALNIAKEIIATDKKTFEINNLIQMDELKSETTKIEAILKTDAQIIALREKILLSFDSQLRNGVINPSEYITELNLFYDAKTNEKIHQTQLELAKINYQTSKGIN